jgi:multiple sugar transport system substrate-binding protein
MGEIFRRAGFILALGLALAVALSTGCKKKEGPVTLRCIGWGGIEEAQIIQQAVDEFRKIHPTVEVRLERAPFGEYITKILTQFSADNAPDVMAVNAEQMVSFASRDIFVDLMPYVDKDASVKLFDFYPEAIDHYTVNGVLTALPRDIAPVAVIYYNKKKFDEAGLPYPKDDWTEADFLKTAQKLTKKTGKQGITQFGYVEDWGVAWDLWVYMHGGSWVDNVQKPTVCTLDSPQAIEGVQFRSDLIHKYRVAPSPANITAMGGMGNSDLFMNGTAAMFFSGIWKTPTFRQIKDFEWDVVETPLGTNGQHAFPMSAAGYSILKTSKNPALAYELVKYLSGETGQKLMAATGLTQPALKTLADSPAFLDGQPPKSKGFLVDAVQYGRFQPYDPNLNEWKAMVDSALDRVWNGDETAESALKKVTAVINEKFYKKPDSTPQP